MQFIPLNIVCGIVKWYNHSRKQSVRLIKLTYTYDSSNLLLGIYTRKMKKKFTVEINFTIEKLKPILGLFVEALFIIAKWKLPKYSSTDELL